jgi:hypothetical protein
MTTRAALHPFVITLAFAAILAMPDSAPAQFDAPLIDTRSAGTSTNVNQEALENIPGARDPWSVLSTSPGVFPAGEPARPSAGMTGDALYTVDGIRIGDYGVNEVVVSDLSAIQEVDVLTGGSTAVYGYRAGSVIQVVTKTGTTNSWQGSGRFLVDGDDASGLGAVQDPSLEIDIAQDAAGRYCLNGFQVMSEGQPVADGDGPVQFAIDQPFTIGVTSGPGTRYGAGDGSLNLSQIPGCAGQPFGLTFVDTRVPYTPPNPTHLFLGQNGSYLVDMGRIGASHGIQDVARTNANALENNHIFRSGFYLAGKVDYMNGGFQLAPQANAVGGRGEPGGAGVFLYGVDPLGIDRDWSIGSRFTYDSKVIRTGDPPAQLPDIDGDGEPDSVFLPLALLAPIGQNAIGGGFRAGAIGSGGGTLAADPTWASPAGDAGVRGILESFFSAYEIGEFTIYRKPDEATPVDARVPDDIGGPIIKDRLWFFGSYGMPGQEPEGEDAPALFSESFYETSPDYTLFRDGSFTEESVQRAPGGRGVQGVGLEVDGQANGMERSWSGDERFVPGGAVALANALDSPILYVVAQGGPTGEVFRVQVVQPESGPVEIHGLVAVEPVAATAEDRARFERELAELAGERYAMTAAGYCLEMDALAPPPGNVYRVAPPEKQAAFAPMRRALDAARRLRDAGALHPDSDPEDYYHSVRQWAVWTVEKGFDRAGFLDAFVARMEQNFWEAGRPWSPDVAAAVRSFGEGRWTDIAAILEAANAPSP